MEAGDSDGDGSSDGGGGASMEGSADGCSVGDGGGSFDGSAEGSGEGAGDADGSDDGSAGGVGSGDDDGASTDGDGTVDGDGSADGDGSTDGSPETAGATLGSGSTAATGDQAIVTRRSAARIAGNVRPGRRTPRGTEFAIRGPRRAPGTCRLCRIGPLRCHSGTLLPMALRVFLGHGASGTAASMRPFVDGLAARGIEAFALDLPRRRAEDAVAAFEAQVPEGPGIVIGGHSYGGRVASLSAAAGRRSYAALVCFSYPLHRPGAPETAAARTAHWPSIACPVLLLCGESDPFARIDLLRAAVPSLPGAQLVTYPRLGHTLRPVLDDVLDRTAAFLRAIEPG